MKNNRKYAMGTQGVSSLNKFTSILGGLSQIGAIAANTAGNEDVTKYIGAVNGFASAIGTVGGSFANRKQSAVNNVNVYRMGSKGIKKKKV